MVAPKSKKDLVVEPAVIDLQALKDGVEPKPIDGSEPDPLQFPKCESLRLSYRNIAEIANLNNFDSLKTLRLDNNIIDRIDNLDHLVNLTWLDLSFNNIREIQGLENLVNLEDLSLYNNHIEEITGLDNCKKLNVLSLGRNKIADFKQVNYLRRFPNLRCVCFEGNKMCQSDSYQQHVLAYLQHLVYLDYMLIDKKQVAQIQESYQLDELTELKEQEVEEGIREKALAEKKVQEDKLRHSFLDTTNNIYDDLFGEIPEHVQALNCLAGLKEEYREKLGELLKTLYAQVQEKNEDRLKRVDVFNKQIEQTYLNSEAESAGLFKKFLSDKKKQILVVKEQTVGGILTDEAAEILRNLQANLEKVDHDLMDVEIELLTTVDDHVLAFESQMGELIKIMANAGKEFYQFLEECTTTFKNDLLLGASTEIEAVASQPEILEHGDDARRQQLLSDREGMTQALANFSDSQLLAVQTKDDQMQAQMSGWMTSFFDAKQKQLIQRNRTRVLEIKQQTEAQNVELNFFLSIGDGAEEEEDD
ncbi:unnamed protein product [Amoebophrya sp. A120]|nr:unnamed protein product [Amoebophrya sp. A120]|eukprot:GSA120T00000436001.1